MTTPLKGGLSGYRFGDITLDVARRRVRRGDDELHLGKLTFDLLQVLAESAPRVVTAEELINRIWSRRVVSPGTVKQRIVLLRQALSDSADHPRYINVVRGHGYALIPDVVAVCDEATPASRGRASTLTGSSLEMPRVQTVLQRVPVLVLSGLVVVTVALLALDRYMFGGETRLRNSIAVLPFENLSPDPAHAYFAAGLHEEIHNRLSKLRNLNVISRTTMMQYAGQTKSLPEIADELKVEAILEGSVRYADREISVTVSLIDAETDADLWSESYRRGFAEILGVQADIATNVANALEVSLSPQEQALVDERPTDSPEAWALYLQAESSDLKTRLALLEQAIEIDPGFALAYARLAFAQAFSLLNSDTSAALSPDESAGLEESSKRNALKAIEIDPRVDYANAALAVPAWTSWRWTEAEAEFSRAIETTPNDEPTRLYYGWLLAWLGRHDEGIALAKRALELNPRDPMAGGFGYQLGAAGDYAAAATVYRNAVASYQGNLTRRAALAQLEIALGNAEAAIAQVQFCEQLAGDRRLLVFLPEWAYVYGRAGRHEDAARIFRELQENAAAGALPGAGGWAMAYLAIDDHDLALKWLEVGAERAAHHERDEGFFNLMSLKINLANNPVLEQPAFIDVRNRLRGN